jgi:molecular chaperone IbpA
MSCLLKEKNMTTYRIDSANLGRALIGFDELFNSFENRLANQIHNNYPPFNVIQIDDSNYEIEIAVAGFQKSEIDIELNQRQLIVTGEHADEEDDSKVYHHRGLAARNFTRSWTLEQYVEVRGAEIKDGILCIKLERVLPEAMKPRKIAIADTIETTQPKIKVA